VPGFGVLVVLMLVSLPFVWIAVLVVGLACSPSTNGPSPSSYFADGFAFNTPRSISNTVSSIVKSKLYFIPRGATSLTTTPLYVAASSAAIANSDDDAATGTSAKDASAKNTTSSTTSYEQKKKTWKELRKEGGPLTFNTPIGALNPYALYYFFVSVTLGIPWVICCKSLQFLYWITGNRFDPQVRDHI